MNQIVQFLSDAETFYLATTDGDQPKVRPFGAVMELEGKICICTANNKAVYAQIQKNPKVEISATYQGKWIRLTGELATCEAQEAKAAMLKAVPSLQQLYKVDDGIFEILYFTKGTATFCSFTEAPTTITF